MQQRRGTAATWTAANPILAAGEIGFETDTNKFKIGDGSNRWVNLNYFVDGASIIDGAPGLLNTLNELAAAVNDDPNFFATVATNLSSHEADTTNVHGIADTAELATKTFAAELLTNANKTNITITGNKNGLTITAENGVADSDTDDLVEGTTNLYFTDERAQDAVGNAVGVGLTYTDSTGEIKVTPNTYDAYGAASTAQTSAQNYADGAISNHNSDTTNVHGIADTSALATKTGSETLTNKTISYSNNTITVQVSNISDITASAAEINLLDGLTASTSELNILDGATISTAELNNLSGITSNIQNQIDDKANLSGASFTGAIDTTGVISTTSSAAASSTSTGAIVATGGLGIGGNAYIGGNLTISGDFVVNGTTTTVSTQDLIVQDPLIYVGEDNNANSVDLGIIASFDDGAYQHTGLVRDASAGTWKLFKGVTDEPTTTVNFSQGSLDDLAVGGLSANTITVGDVSNTEFGYLNGVTSGIQSQLNSKAPTESPTFTGTVSGITKSMVGLGNVDNTTDDSKPVSVAQASAISIAKSEAVSDAQTYTNNQINALDTDDIEEGTTNLYFTNERAQDAIGNLVGTGLSYNDSTGVISVTSNTYDAYGSASTAESNAASYTDNAINALDTDDIEEGSSNFYFTNERAQDAIGNNVGNGLSYNDSTGVISVDTTVIATKAELAEVSQDSVNDAIVAGTGLDKTYDDVNNTITIDIDSTVTTNSGTQTLTNKTLTSPKVNEDVALTATSTELNVLDGITASTSELNILDGVTASASEINVLDGIVSTTSELNILSGVTATSLEINTLDGMTATTSELNVLDGITVSTSELNSLEDIAGNVQTLLDAKAPLASPTLTGTPTAPTAAIGTNTAQIATTSFVDAAILDIVNRNLILDGGGV